jgi:hypothetical protein
MPGWVRFKRTGQRYIAMNDWLGRLMLLFPVWPVVAIASAVVFYARHSHHTNAERRLPVLLYVAVVLAAGAIAAFGGMLVGANWACSRPESGNLCGLAGVLVTGPMAGSAAIFIVAFALSRL